MLTRPRVSVVIPCYRYGHFLGQCVSSVLEQEGVDLDVTIIDDASPDDSAAVARRLAEADERIRVVVHEANQGHIATYNEGLAAADGDYVLLLSADDMLAPGALARAAALMETHPEVGLVYGFARTFADRPPPARTAVRSWSIWPGAEWLELVGRRVTNPIYTPEAVMRTKTMHELVGYDHRLPHAADFLMWLRAASRVSIGRVNGVDQAYYRFHGHNMHMERFPGALRDLRERHLAFEILFEELGDAVPVGLREAASAGVAREALVLAVQGYRHGPPPPDQATTLGQLVAFAAEIHPPSRRSRPGRAYDAAVTRARAGKGPLIPAAVTAPWDRALRHVRWRRWRATGIDGPVGSV
jgi:glycosyltransferase involved in cell wall biosynthesis